MFLTREAKLLYSWLSLQKLELCKVVNDNMVLAESSKYEYFVVVYNHSKLVTRDYQSINTLDLCPNPFPYIENPDVSQR